MTAPSTDPAGDLSNDFARAMYKEGYRDGASETYARLSSDTDKTPVQTILGVMLFTAIAVVMFLTLTNPHLPEVTNRG